VPHAGPYVCALSNIRHHEYISDPHSCMDVLCTNKTATFTEDRVVPMHGDWRSKHAQAGLSVQIPATLLVGVHLFYMPKLTLRNTENYRVRSL
jgi:hypothetical protein